MNYKDTLNLPQTGFPMKAGLVEREPQRLARWYEDDIYARIRERHAKAQETFVLHDGPPFANGDVHSFDICVFYVWNSNTVPESCRTLVFASNDCFCKINTLIFGHTS